MLSRQRTILKVLASTGPSRSKIDLVKLLFLMSEEHPNVPRPSLYEFLPYHYGPYSFTLDYDLCVLERQGMIRQTRDDASLTALGRSEARRTAPEASVAVQKVKHDHGDKTTNELVDHIYGTYRWYTVNSKWVERRAMERPRADPAIYTTGYEGVTIDGLLDRLLRAGVERLIDVRSNPIARRYGFHKSTLALLCPRVGVEYVHVPELGVPSAWRADLSSQEAYSSLFARYENEILPEAEQAMIRLELMTREKGSALMCMEADPTCCHRTTLAAALAKRTGLPVRELGRRAPHALF